MRSSINGAFRALLSVPEFAARSRLSAIVDHESVPDAPIAQSEVRFRPDHAWPRTAGDRRADKAVRSQRQACQRAGPQPGGRLVRGKRTQEAGVGAAVMA